MEKELWNVYEERDEDGGYGDAVFTQTHVGTVWATDQEIEEFLKIWDRPRIYDRPYASLSEHHIWVEKVSPIDIKSFEPYDPRTRDWPDVPYGVSYFCQWDGEKWVEP